MIAEAAACALAVVVALVVAVADTRRRRRARRIGFLVRCRDLQNRADGLNDYLETRGQRAYVDVTTDPPRLVVAQLGDHPDDSKAHR